MWFLFHLSTFNTFRVINVYFYHQFFGGSPGKIIINSNNNLRFDLNFPAGILYTPLQIHSVPNRMNFELENG